MIAGGGSYTHAKDLPYIGQIVVEVLKGTKNHTQFGWDESSTQKSFDNQPALRTDLNFRDLELEASKDKRVQRWRETRSIGVSDLCYEIYSRTRALSPGIAVSLV